jgi:hypothetical protein
MARPARGSPWTKRVIVPQDYADARPGPVAASFSGKTNERSFFRRASLAQAIDNDRWGRRLCQKPFDCESRKEATRLCQGRFRLGVVPLRGLSSRQHGVGNVGWVSRVDGMLSCSIAASSRPRQISAKPRLQMLRARPRRTGGQGGQRNLSGYMPLDESGMVQDESGGAARGGWAVRAKTHQWPP